MIVQNVIFLFTQELFSLCLASGKLGVRVTTAFAQYSGFSLLLVFRSASPPWRDKERDLLSFYDKKTKQRRDPFIGEESRAGRPGGRGKRKKLTCNCPLLLLLAFHLILCEEGEGENLLNNGKRKGRNWNRARNGLWLLRSDIFLPLALLRSFRAGRKSRKSPPISYKPHRKRKVGRGCNSWQFPAATPYDRKRNAGEKRPPSLLRHPPTHPTHFIIFSPPFFLPGFGEKEPLSLPVIFPGHGSDSGLGSPLLPLPSSSFLSLFSRLA